MKWKVLVTAPYMQSVIDRFRNVFEENDVELIIPPVKERMEEEELLNWISDIDGVICGDDRFTEHVLRSASELKVLSKWGTGIDSIDSEACRKLGIAVKRTPNAFSEPVADSVIGYMLCFVRKLPWMDKCMKDGVWDKIPGMSLGECTLGVIGVGDVGKTLVRRSMAFGMKILGNDIKNMPSEFLSETDIEMVSKEDLLRQADFVSLNCDLNDSSFHLMSDDEFDLMKPAAVLINTSRGPVVDEQALVRALKNKKLAGAGLDVFETEPLPGDSPLMQMDNVMLAPHNANSSPEAWEQVHQNTINNLLAELQRSKK